jgi:hypothetical protein
MLALALCACGESALDQLAASYQKAFAPVNCD